MSMVEIPDKVLQVASWFMWAGVISFTVIFVATFLGHWAGGMMEKYL